jgi:hypothetical protein
MVSEQVMKFYETLHETSWNWNIHYHVHKSQPKDPILTQINSIYILTPYIFKIRFNVNLPTRPRFSE